MLANLLIAISMIVPQYLALEHQCPPKMVWFAPWEDCIARFECKKDRDCGSYSTCDETEGYCVPI